jgi:two-component system response regulator YesN
MLKVLLVDDEPYVLEGLRVMVDWAANGFIICGEASNGIDALEIIKMRNPDVVITDIRIPGISGLELIKQSYEQLNSTARFVILSGYDEFSYVKQAMNYNIRYYLLKPLDDVEFTEVISKLSVEIKEERSRQQNTNRQISFVVNQCIRRLISGEKKESLISRVSLLLGIGKQDEIRCLLIEISKGMDKKPIAEADLNEKKKIARQIIEEEIGSNFQFNVFEDDNDRIGIITCGKMTFNTNIEEFADRLLTKIKSSLLSDVTLSVSCNETGAEAVDKIYELAAFTLEFKFYIGEGKVIYYEDVKNLKFSNDVDIESIKSLLLPIRANNVSELAIMVEEIFIYFEEALISPSLIISALKSFLLEMVRLLIDLNVNLNKFLDTALIFDKCMEQLTISELQAAFLSECQHAAALIESSKCCSSQLIICQIKEYILQNYFREIKLKKVAQEFYMNPVYLGQVFKKSTGMQFNEYLNSVRIEEAKKLLSRTDMKVIEVSKAVGFNDPKYFLSKFKSIVNLPPSAFKTE